MNMHNSGVPGGYIGLGDAYEKVFRQLERADELAAAIAPDKWQLASDSSKSRADQLALTAYDDARDRVADTMGQAIVDSELDVYYTDLKTGSPMLCVDRDVFARHASAVPGFGLTNYVDSIGRPAPEPALRDGLIVYLASQQFEKWRAKIVSSNRKKYVSRSNLESAYLEHVNLEASVRLRGTSETVPARPRPH